MKSGKVTGPSGSVSVNMIIELMNKINIEGVTLAEW